MVPIGMCVPYGTFYRHRLRVYKKRALVCSYLDLSIPSCLKKSSSAESSFLSSFEVGLG